jgi:methylated-DNA-protein-cysteine methyltransferase-like protein
MQTFEQKVVKIIKRIPHGKVMSYGQVAACVGSPRAAIIVGQILKHKTAVYDLPWQRVINSKGIISIVNMEFPEELQAKLLEDEGIPVERRNDHYWVNLQKYNWLPGTK